MSDVQDFIKEKGLQPTRSTLTPYVAEILELRELGFSYRVIAEFLHEKKGLKTSFQNVAAFIRSRSTQTQATTPQKTTTNAQIAPTPEHTPNVQENTPARRGLRKPTPTKRFNWEDRPDPESLK